MTERSWKDVLGSFSDRLEDQRAALLEGAADSVPPFVPPAHLGPIPEALRGRAEQLLREAAEIEAALEAGLAATSREARVVRRLVTGEGGSPRASYVDSSL